MGKGRDPVPIESFKMLAGYSGMDESLVCYVPTTDWAQQ